VADQAMVPSWSRSAIAGLRISRTSFIWTLVAGICSILIGLAANSLVLVAFGAVGFFDAAGSATLIIHFRHSLRHDRLSDRHEKLALGVITVGMAILGVGTAVEGLHRLIGHVPGERAPGGVVLAAISAVVLGVLAMRKHRIAPRIPSHALRADGWLSTLGAGLALVTLAGTGLESAFGWSWIDPAAALAVAGGAVTMSFLLWREGTAAN
jgi:divalent metal cation (Fe/Co/Zn/Cd) transporter